MGMVLVTSYDRQIEYVRAMARLSREGDGGVGRKDA